MSEMAKTVVFVVVGVAGLGFALLVDVANQPKDSGASPKDQIGKPLFEDFDALAVTELEIVKWDEGTGTPRFFKVAQVNNLWSIPSHSNYPADAKDQLEKAAPSVMGLKVVDFESDNPSDFSEYGVVDPGSGNVKAGTTGVGTRVVMKDAKGKELVALVVGKQVPDRDDLHYVRRVGQDPIYTVNVDPGKLSTKFQDWIEKDLLKMSTWDIKQVRVLDYSFDEVAGQPRVRGQFAVEYDDAGDTHWKLLESKVLDLQAGKWTDRALSEGEELDSEKLNDLKYALDDLKIVNVARKPEGLSADLRDTGNLQPNQEAWTSLAQKGFYLLPVGDRQYELISNEGEVRVLMKDGVQYTLRFGEIVEDTSGGDDKKPEEGEEEEAEKDSSELNRYIFVMAEFNPDLIEKPELEPLPELPEKPEEAGAAEPPAAETEGEKTPAEEPAGAPEEEPEENEEGPAEDKPAEEAPASTTESADPTAAAEESQSEAAPAPAGEAPQATEEAPAAEAPAEAGEQPAEKSFEEQLEELTKERERIEKENQRKKDEYEKKLEDGKKRVAELNDRFADWYYVISDEVYQKIHLNFDQIVKEKEKEEGEGEGQDAEGGMAEVTDAADTPDEKAEEPQTVLDELDQLDQQGPGGDK